MQSVGMTIALTVWALMVAGCMTKKVKNPEDLSEKNPGEKRFAPGPSDKEASSQSGKPGDGFAVIGDSFAVGTMSDTRLGMPSPAPFDDFFPIASYFKGIFSGVNPETELPRTMVDDSFKKHAFNAFNSAGIESVAVIFNNKADSVQNLGISGASLQMYRETITPQLKMMHDNHRLIFVEIGTSDYCSVKYKPEDFKKSYQRMVDEIIAKSKKLKKLILLPAFPVFRLADFSDSLLIDFSQEADPLQKFLSEMVFEGGKKELKCRESHRVFCSPIVDKTREENWSRWESVNSAIKEVAGISAKKYPGMLVIYPAELLKEVKLTRELLAMDCFHLGKKFHEKFAKDLSAKVPSDSGSPPGKLEPVKEKK